MFKELDFIYNQYDKFSPNFKTINVVDFNFNELHNLFIKKFLKSLDEESSKDEYWAPFRTSIFKYYMSLRQYPLSFNNAHLLSDTDIEFVAKSVIDCKEVYPSVSDLVSDILIKIRELKQLNIRPYSDAINNIVMNNFGKTFVLILTSQNTEMYDLIITDPSTHNLDKRVKIINEMDFLKEENKNYDNVFFIGGPSSYNSRTFLNTNFLNAYILKYSFMNQNFFNFLNFNSYVWTRKITSNSDIEEIKIDKNFLMDELNLLTTEENFEVEYFMNQIIKNVNADPSTSEEKYEARICSLVNNYICFLTDHKGYDEKQDVFDLSDPDNPKYIRGKMVSSIQPGDFVVLKDGGGSGSDLIRELANKKLGNKATSYRDQQKLWKKSLLNFIQINTLEIAKKKMFKIGIIYQPYWLHEDNIKLKNKDKFDKLIELIEFPILKKETLWHDLESIDRAHKSAGNDISKILKDKIKSENIDLLIANGFKIYTIPDTQASMGVYKILKIFNNKREIPKSKLDKVYSRKEMFNF